MNQDAPMTLAPPVLFATNNSIDDLRRNLASVGTLVLYDRELCRVYVTASMFRTMLNEAYLAAATISPAAFVNRLYEHRHVLCVNTDRFENLVHNADHIFTSDCRELNANHAIFEPLVRHQVPNKFYIYL